MTMQRTSHLKNSNNTPLFFLLGGGGGGGGDRPLTSVGVSMVTPLFIMTAFQSARGQPGVSTRVQSTLDYPGHQNNVIHGYSCALNRTACFS